MIWLAAMPRLALICALWLVVIVLFVPAWLTIMLAGVLQWAVDTAVETARGLARG